VSYILRLSHVVLKREWELGFAFKKDTNDTRESPAISVCRDLLEEQANVAIFDPKVTPETIYRDLQTDASDERVSIMTDPYEAMKDAHAVAILTEWDAFKDYDWQKVYDNMLKPAFVFDGRNILDLNKLREIGFEAFGIGQGGQRGAK